MEKKANECGYTIDTWDVHPIESAHVLWFIDFPRERKELTNVKKRNPKAKYILQILESPTLGPHFLKIKTTSILMLFCHIIEIYQMKSEYSAIACPIQLY
ncbi:hypothetical protein NXS98_00910 [Fontisphaera persica]|uniref:hypothetical protein n=1 Tax=Fontisphaera persica TaxID=2974023 RepID=UPI0024C09B1F|nr:hypothetical protein [Fontisphaera persica]WCJ59707.1 hypothetical protein NXS98_00910 [Fontisphaera persica]